MNQYLISSKNEKIQNTNGEKDPTYVGTFVVFAKDETRARQFATSYGEKELKILPDAWTNPEHSYCKLLRENVQVDREQLLLKEFCSKFPILKLNSTDQLAMSL